MKIPRKFSRDVRVRLCWASLAAYRLLAPGQAGAQSPTPAVVMEAAPSATVVASATPAETVAATTAHGPVLYPANGPQKASMTAPGNGATGGMSSLAMSFLMLLGLCAGGYYLLRRQTGFAPASKGQRKLLVTESRSLGNRQFLVVVEYESERILIGVTPGKIDYLCPLPGASPSFKESLP